MSQRTVIVGQEVLAERRAAAARFRSLRMSQGTLVVHLLSSPGSGKTSLLEATARHLGKGRRLGVLVGDLATDRDAQRLAPLAATVQITTGGACHLELPLVERALGQLGRSDLEFLFIEDVGNLVCPASHDLGEHVRGLAEHHGRRRQTGQVRQGLPHQSGACHHQDGPSAARAVLGDRCCR